MEMTCPKIAIVGCGPGSADYLPPAARQAVAEAEVLAGAERLLELFPESRAERIVVTGHIADVLDRIQASAQEKPVAVLVSGDPCLFSLGLSVLKRFGRDRCRLIPAVSSVQVAFARAGLDWQDAKIVSAHYNLPVADELDFKDYTKLAILTGHKEISSWLAELASRMEADMEVWVCENLTLENERVRKIDIQQLGKIEMQSRAIVLMAKRE